ncbi:MAG: hypothetical protein ACK2UU_14565 [Anaerolineae bacterium]
MLTLGDALSEMELRKDLLVEVEQLRLARLATGRELGWQVRVVGEAAARLSRRVMVRFGAYLVECGCELQSRFSVKPRRTAG